MGDNKEETGRLIKYLKETAVQHLVQEENEKKWIAERNKNEKGHKG
jgi:hypothetical protein